MEKALISWSSGKDSAMALHETIQSRRFEPVALLTTLTTEYDRVSMHGVRRDLLEAQAAALGLKLEIVGLTVGASDAEYEAQLTDVLTRYQAQGVSTVVFGDIFLEDLRRYREEQLARVGMRAHFPLWRRDTHELAEDLATLGFKAVTTCVDTRVLGAEFVGREIEAAFLAELPEGVDWCGENGEYHSVVLAGPIFPNPISHELGEVVLRDERFCYCDVLIAEPSAAERHAPETGTATPGAAGAKALASRVTTSVA